MRPTWRLPAFLDARRLEGRIVGFFLLLLLIVQASNYVLVDRTIDTQLLRRVDQNLDSSQRNLLQELQRRLPREQAKAMVLAQDNGFVEAVGGLHLDEAGLLTLKDAIDNLRRRAGAQFVAYVDNQDRVISTHAQAAAAVDLARSMPVVEMGDSDGSDGDPTLNFALLAGEPLQFVRVPVRVPVSSPHPSGLLVLGYQLRAEQLTPIKRYANVEVAIGLQTPKGWPKAVDIEGDEQLPQLLAQGARLAEGVTAPLEWQGIPLRARRFALPILGAAPGEQLSCLLWVNLTEEMGNTNALRKSLLLLNLAGIGLFALGSIFTARRLTGPIQALRGFARRLGQGDYETPVPTPSGVAEVQALATSFETMRQGIREKQADIERYAYWDRLTGLPNRAQFVERLAAALRNPAPLGLLLLNLDRFKPVNDLLGRERGDLLLVQVAERLRAVVPSGDALLARLGGDEFALFLRGPVAAIDTLAAELHHALSEPVNLEWQGPPRTAEHPTGTWLKVDVGTSIGIALAPEHEDHPDDLIRMAERAMDVAKRRRNGTVHFEPGMDPRSEFSLSLRSELTRAIEHNELRLFLQPKRSLQGGHTGLGQLDIFAAEALVRWQHPQRGMVPPGQFIPFAEETGFVRHLTQWVLRAAARQAAEAQARGLHLLVAVNLSTRDLLEADLLDKLQTMLREERCEPGWLSLEITESAIMDDPQRALEMVRALEQAGFKLAIDDFGTGYSSLAYLQKLPVDEVKIDQSFVFGLEDTPHNQTIVRSTIQLAHELGKRVVAEGVETEAALRLLQGWGCDEAQGYHIARPMPAEKLIEKLSDGSLETRL